MLPTIKISFENGALESVSPSADCVGGLICTGKTVGTTLVQTNSYILYKLSDLTALGVTAESSDDNAFLYKVVKEFYAQAGDGAELWLMIVPSTVKASDMLDKNQDYAKKLIKDANGRLRFMMVAFNPETGYTIDITQGVEKDVVTSLSNGQALAEWATTELYAPLFFLLEGREYKEANITSLPELTENSDNRVAVLIGDTITASKGAAIGLLGGKIAENPVYRHIGRVKDGSLEASEIFIDEKDPKLANVETLNNKGFITFRTFTGKSGYFITDDCLATSINDDYRSIARRRTIDKAYRIVYQTMLNHINDEIPVTNDGNLVSAICKAWEQEIISAIYNEMTLNGELGVDSTDDTDKGVKAFIDYEQKVLITNKIEMSVQVKPYGYAKYINIDLGFTTTES